MAKIQLLAILSLDGCLSDMETDGHWWLRPETHGLDEVRDRATFEITPEHPLSMLIAAHGKKDGTVWQIEATTETADFINAMLRMRLIDEIVFYTVPFIAGTGIRLFQDCLPTSHWELSEQRAFAGAVRNIYRRVEVAED